MLFCFCFVELKFVSFKNINKTFVYSTESMENQQKVISSMDRYEYSGKFLKKLQLQREKK